MKRRLFGVSLFVAGSAFALASLLVVWSTVGRGVVRNAEGRMAEFHVEASKRVHGHAEPRIGGTVVLSTGTHTHGVRLTIKVHGYQQDGNTSLVMGPAVLRRVTSTCVCEIPGRGRARFVSNRHPEEQGDMDSMEVAFESEHPDQNFSFGGHVVRGDVTISRTESH
jgi:hypothetical protein